VRDCVCVKTTNTGIKKKEKGLREIFVVKASGVAGGGGEWWGGGRQGVCGWGNGGGW
jgi:hypothetical protein